MHGPPNMRTDHAIDDCCAVHGCIHHVGSSYYCPIECGDVKQTKTCCHCDLEGIESVSDIWFVNSAGGKLTVAYRYKTPPRTFGPDGKGGFKEMVATGFITVNGKVIRDPLVIAAYLNRRSSDVK